MKTSVHLIATLYHDCESYTSIAYNIIVIKLMERYYLMLPVLI